MSSSLSFLRTISSEKIAEISSNPSFSPYLQIVKRSSEATAEKVVEPHLARPQTLVFISTQEHLSQVLAQEASIIVALDKLKPQEIQLESHQALFATPSIPAAMALILPLFDTKDQRFTAGVHPTAIIDSTAQIGADVRIGAYAVIGAHVQIGSKTCIGAHTVIESGAIIGSKTLLHPHVFIGAHCRIGNSCEIHPHTTIGSDGFGYIQGPDQKRNKIPQIGIVVLGDSVEMGANCAVDRATLGETIIGDGSKFDNFCHIAHNCKIGKNNVFAAGFSVAGSSEIGDNCMVGGQVGVADHVKIGSHIILGGRSGVTKDLMTPGAYAGFPLEPMRDAVRTLANMAQLTNMRKQIAQIKKHIGMKDTE